MSDLDEAWAEVEATLPRSGWLSTDGRWVIPTGRESVTLVRVQSGDGYYEPIEDGYKAFATVEPDFMARGDLGTTPAEALHALARRLAASPDKGEPR